MNAMSDAPADGRHLLTIGQLARYAGVTIKAVRHYHRRGLLPEPSRDPSGYRRYTAEHAIQLVKIKTLAEAGAPLAHVKELLTAGADQFSAAIAQIDRDLGRQAEKIRRSRQHIAQLHAGDRLFVSAAVADYLDRLRQLSVSERAIHQERDMWILLHAVSPDEADNLITSKLTALDDPEFCALYREYDAAFDWSPDDPRLPALAERAQRWLARRNREHEQRIGPDPTIARLAAASVDASSPAWTRLAELAGRPGARPRPCQPPHD
jgi:DNA-binding transcriptional MerR regulator